MAEKHGDIDQDSPQLRQFTRHLLRDLQALERMLDEDLIEKGKRRIGVEQETVLAGPSWNVAPEADQILAGLQDLPVTNELAQFNLEINVPPKDFGGKCLEEMEQYLADTIAAIEAAGESLDIRVLLCGILPTINMEDLVSELMTEKPRYKALESAIQRLRGGKNITFDIKGVDELHINHKSVMIESCNTSFQVHFQVSPNQFPHWYNIAQTATGPVLAAAVNSPILFRRRLWRETRIAIFQRAVDTRSDVPQHRQLQPRVYFGQDWVRQSALELYREEVSRFRLMFAMDIDEDPIQILDEGGVPELQALQLHNSTVYRWNRACYGVAHGKAHLRIENRTLPAGPTLRDEFANAAFWFGLISGLSTNYDDITRLIQFDEVKENFFGAARDGLSTRLTWIDGKVWSAPKLILNDLLPLAESGLKQSGIDNGNAETYLDVIEQRVGKSQTGAQWHIKSLSGMTNQGTPAERMVSLTSTMYEYQRENLPVHRWELANLDDSRQRRYSYLTVGQYMQTDLFTVDEDTLIDLVAQMMVWNNIRHVLVEDNDHQLKGLVSYRSLLRLAGEQFPTQDGKPAPVQEIMIQDPVTVSPETSTLNAIKVMQNKGISCLPVVKNERLVGLITERDLMSISRHLLEKHLRDDG